LIGKPEGKKSPGKPRRRWIDNLKVDQLKVELGDVDCIGLAQDRYRWRSFVNAVMNLRVPENSGKLPIGCTTDSLSSGVQPHIDSQPVS
jgi:hypothetical protein